MTTRLYYAPKTRSFTALWLLEELEIPYELETLLLNSGEHKKQGYLEISPMGKVPAVLDDDVAIAETGAIALYLADKYSAAGLSPALTSADRAAYLRWVVFASGVIEPAIGEKLFHWDVPKGSVAWGSFDDMIEVVTNSLAARDWLAGERFSAADIVVGSALTFGVKFGVISPESPIGHYVRRLSARPAYKRAQAIETAEIERIGLVSY